MKTFIIGKLILWTRRSTKGREMGIDYRLKNGGFWEFTFTVDKSPKNS